MLRKSESPKKILKDVEENPKLAVSSYSQETSNTTRLERMGQLQFCILKVTKNANRLRVISINRHSKVSIFVMGK